MAENVQEMISSINENSAQLNNFWPKVTEEIRGLTAHDVRTQELPLARIKRIMKLDEEVKMISAEAPALFSKAAEIFITELTLRAWIHTEDNKRRTLQKNDIAMAITKYDQFDFLIDIVPREEIKPAKREDGARVTVPEQHYFHIAQHYQNVLQQGTTATPTNTTTSPTQQAIQIVQTGQQATPANAVTNQVTHTEQQPTQIIQLPAQPQQQQQQPQQQPQQTTQQQGGIQIIQQIMGADGQVQQIPIPLTPQQVQMLRLQMSGASTQPIIIQTPIQAVNQQSNQSTSSSQPQILQLQSIS